VGREQVDARGHVGSDDGADINAGVAEHAGQRVLVPRDYTERAAETVLWVSVNGQRAAALTQNGREVSRRRRLADTTFGATYR